MTTPSEPKLVVVVGATGNQGNSVARRFLREGFHVRGLTRYPDSPASQYLTSLGAEMARADIFDVESLKAAFKGARVIFSVTNYWDPFHPDRLQESRAKAKALNMGTVREYAGHVERIAGQNIADAAATTVETLDGNGFIASTLSHAGKCSGGRFRELHHFDAKADVFPYYVRDEFPDLAAKMSCVQTGFFMSSHRILPDSYLAKLADGSFEMRLCTDPRKPVPHLDPVADMGNFVYAVYRMSSWCGREYMAAGATCTWPQWLAAWSKAAGKPAQYRRVTRGEMIRTCGDTDFGTEITDMFDYSSEPGYDGGRQLLGADDLVREGIACPMTILEEWMGAQDWSGVLSKPPTSTH